MKVPKTIINTIINLICWSQAKSDVQKYFKTLLSKGKSFLKLNYHSLTYSHEYNKIMRSKDEIQNY